MERLEVTGWTETRREGIPTYPWAISCIKVELAPLSKRLSRHEMRLELETAHHGSSLVASWTLASISLTLSTTFLACVIFNKDAIEAECFPHLVVHALDIIESNLREGVSEGF
jgi:hypothetical protein